MKKLGLIAIELVVLLLVVSSANAEPTPSPENGGIIDASDNSNNTSAWLFVAFGLAALAFGVGGATVVRRPRR